MDGGLSLYHPAIAIRKRNQAHPRSRRRRPRLRTRLAAPSRSAASDDAADVAGGAARVVAGAHAGVVEVAVAALVEVAGLEAALCLGKASQQLESFARRPSEKELGDDREVMRGFVPWKVWARAA